MSTRRKKKLLLRRRKRAESIDVPPPSPPPPAQPSARAPRRKLTAKEAGEAAKGWFRCGEHGIFYAGFAFKKSAPCTACQSPSPASVTRGELEAMS